ncbi:cobQ/CobB/MinD/ParA nucleotide binding domain protein, partial [Vibrio parahaemolyticus V-223/04]
NKFLLPARFW